MIRQKKSSHVSKNFLLNKSIDECTGTIVNGTILIKLYYDLSIGVFPINLLNDKNEIVKSDSNQGELGKSSKLSSMIPSLVTLINRTPY
jgi:hypothetical protein